MKSFERFEKMVYDFFYKIEKKLNELDLKI